MKNVGTVNHLYFYVNGMLLMEYRYNAMGDTTDVLQYFYDANGKPHAMAYNGTVYLYVTNLQGDIVALLGLDGTVSGYEYDPYGNVIASYGDIAAINPLRYRGYYYDNETGLYYLQSRYYDPVVGRFINADSYASTGQGIIGYNMYTYCGNNPILYVDRLGTRYVCAPTYWDGRANYIYDQNADEIGNKPFGNSTISHSGCGVVATYNALVSLGDSPDIDEIIQSYERSGNLLFGGLAGMPYRAVADYFTDAGYDVSMYTGTELFSYFASQSDASVIWYTWANSSGMGMHFFHVDSVAGLNRGYNVYSNESTVRYLPSNISDFFSGSDGKYSVIICINRG